MRAFALLLLGSSLVSACGSSRLGPSPDGAAPVDAAPVDAAAPSDTSDAGDEREAATSCPPALASAGELASTPRADVNLELLALKLSPGKLVADEATYQRVVRDVGAIRAKYPEHAMVSFASQQDGRTVSFVLPLETAEQMQAGTYHAWDCLNEAYGAVMPFEFIRIGNADNVYAYIKLKGLYNVGLLAAEYARLPGVTSTESSISSGGIFTICATSGPATWHYVFDSGSNDCPYCIDHLYRHFTTDPDGTVAALESWDTTSGTARPAWVTQLVSPAICH